MKTMDILYTDEEYGVAEDNSTIVLHYTIREKNDIGCCIDIIPISVDKIDKLITTSSVTNNTTLHYTE